MNFVSLYKDIYIYILIYGEGVCDGAMLGLQIGLELGGAAVRLSEGVIYYPYKPLYDI